MRRRAEFLPISEGHQRYHLGDYLKHLSYARASLGEVETDLVLIEKTVPASVAEAAECSVGADEVGRMLTNLCASLRKRQKRLRQGGE